MDNVMKHVKNTIIIIAGIGIISLGVLIIFGFLSADYTPDIGSLIGGTLGGIGTLIAILFTLKDSTDKFTKQQHDSIKPFFNAWHLCGAVNCDSYMRECSVYDLVYYPSKGIVMQKVNYNTNLCFYREIVVENIGLGSATNIHIEIEKDGSVAKLENTFSLAKDKSTIRRLIIPTYIDHSIPIWKSSVGKYILSLTYEDMGGWKYKQTIKFELIEDESVDEKINLQDFIEISMPERI